MFHGRLKWRPFVILLKASAVKTVNEHYFTVNWRQQATKRIQLNSQPRRISRMILQPGDLMMGGLWVKIKILKSPQIRPFLFSFTSSECKYPIIIRTANSANGGWKAVKRMKCGLLAAYYRMVYGRVNLYRVTPRVKSNFTNSANGGWKAVKSMKCGLLAAYYRMVTDGWIYTG